MSELWAHMLLIAGEIIGTVFVGWGIIWEGPAQSIRRHKIAPRLVIFGIIVETVCSISLFVYDERISQEQQTKIITLETRLAGRTLSASQIADLKAAIAPYGEHKFQIESYWFASEPAGIAAQLRDEVLVSSKWSQIQDTSRLAGVIAGVLVFEPQAGVDPSGADAARAIVAGLKAADIDATLLPNARIPHIDIEVGIKP